MGNLSTEGVVEEKTSTSPDDTPSEAGEVAHASNGNVIDDGLQRGLKNRHLVSILTIKRLHVSDL